MQNTTTEKTTYNVIEETKEKGTLVVEPLEDGLGYEMGNALQMILLTQLNDNPIESVSYKCEAVDGNEKLIMEVITNGSITSRVAIGEAARLLKYQMLEQVERKKVYVPVKPPEPLFKTNQNLYRKVSSLELSVRAHNAMMNANIQYVGDLASMEEKELAKMPNVGFTTGHFFQYNSGNMILIVLCPDFVAQECFRSRITIQN